MPAAVFIVAGEISGDMQAADLAAALRSRDRDLSLVGIGGARMATAGVRILEDSTTWGVIGYVDPLLRIRTYLRRLRAVEAAVRAIRPDVLVLVDFAAFNLRLAERLRGAVRIAYYVPPMVSIRRGDRARKVARLGMRLLATLRREADAYAAAGADVVFVGHPAVDLAARTAPPDEARGRLHLPEQGPVVGLMPGSRLQEIRSHVTTLLDAAALITREIPDAAFVLPVPAQEIEAAVAAAVREHRAAQTPVLITAEIHTAMRAADVLVVATGTATLEAAVLGIPMVAVYRLPLLSWMIINRLVTIRHAALPNILAGREIVPELLQDRLVPGAVADTVIRLLRDPRRREAMRADLLAVAAGLGASGAPARAADEVLRLVR